MKNTNLVLAPESLQTLQNCKEFKTLLLQEIKEYQQQLKKIADVKKYTKVITQEMAKLEQKIKDNQAKLEEVEAMLVMQPGNWVRNGSTTPGQIVDLRIVGRVPEVQVLWWRNTAPVPECPRKLQKIEPSDLEYVWNGQLFPKLVRRIDKQECEELAVLKKNYESSRRLKRTAIDGNCPQEIIDIHNREIVYCRKRFNLLTEQQFPAGIRVKVNGLQGTTLEYLATQHYIMNGNRYLINVQKWKTLMAAAEKAKRP